MGTFTDNFAVQSRDNLLPLTRAGLYLAAGFFAGRKVVQGTSAAFFALSAKVADHLAIDRETIEEGSWRQWFHVNRDRFVEMTRQNVHRDLALAGILATGGLVTEQIETRLNTRIKNQQADESIYAKTRTYRYKEAGDDLKSWLFDPKPVAHSSPWMDAVRRFRITDMKFTSSTTCGPRCQAAIAHEREILSTIFAPVLKTLNQAWVFSGKWSHKGWNLSKTGFSGGKSGLYWTGQGISNGWSYTQEHVYGTKTFSNLCQSTASSVARGTVWTVLGAKDRGLQGVGIGWKGLSTGWHYGKVGANSSWRWSKGAFFATVDKTIDWSFAGGGWLYNQELALAEKLANKMK